MKTLTLGLLAAAFVPCAASAQHGQTHLGPCGDTTAYDNEYVAEFIAPQFVDTEYEDWRSDLGLYQQSPSVVMEVVVDDKVCRDLRGVLREALRSNGNPTTLRINDVVPTFMKIGQYYFVALELANPLPEGTEAREPAVIIDGLLMRPIRVVLW